MATASALRLNSEQLHHQLRSCQLTQESYQKALDPWGVQVPRPITHEDPTEYSRRLLPLLVEHLPDDHKWRSFRPQKVDDDILARIEPQILQAVADSAFDPRTIPPGEMRKRVTTTANGQQQVEWIGPTSFVLDFVAPNRRVVSWHDTTGVRTPGGRYIPVR